MCVKRRKRRKKEFWNVVRGRWENGKFFGKFIFIHGARHTHTRVRERRQDAHTAPLLLLINTRHHTPWMGEWRHDIGATELRPRPGILGRRGEREREKLCKYSRWNDSRTDSKKKKICCCDVARCWNLINIPPSQPRLTPPWLWLQPFFFLLSLTLSLSLIINIVR